MQDLMQDLKHGRARHHIAVAALACGAWCSQAAAHGTVEIHNSLPIDVQCAVLGTHRSAEGPLQHAQLFQPAVAIPAFTSLSIAVPWTVWPPRPEPDQRWHRVSDAFSHLRLVCESGFDPATGRWRQLHSAEFYADLAVDGADADASLPTAGSRHRSGEHVFAYPLTVVTPTASTEFIVQLVPHEATVTMAQLEQDATIDARLAAFALHPDGERLHAEPQLLGRFALHRDASFDDASGWQSDSAQYDCSASD